MEKICEETKGIVSVANYNCPGQIVISGEEKAVNQAAEKMKEAGAKRCMPLKVSGPFHTSMLEEAGKKLAEELEHVTVGELTAPYISNVTAEYVLPVLPPPWNRYNLRLPWRLLLPASGQWPCRFPGKLR